MRVSGRFGRRRGFQPVSFNPVIHQGTEEHRGGKPAQKNGAGGSLGKFHVHEKVQLLGDAQHQSHGDEQSVSPFFGSPFTGKHDDAGDKVQAQKQQAVQKHEIHHLVLGRIQQRVFLTGYGCGYCNDSAWENKEVWAGRGENNGNKKARKENLPGFSPISGKY